MVGAGAQVKVGMRHPELTALRREHTYTGVGEPGATKKQIMELVKKHKVQFIDLQFTDLPGMVKGVTIPVHKLEKAIDHNVWFDGSSIEGFTRIHESDMYLKLDLDTFGVLPWTRNQDDTTARIICDVYLPDGTSFIGDPRCILRKQIKEAKKLGYDYYLGPELEFFLFKKDSNGKLSPIPHDQAGYFDQTMDLGTEIRREMSFALDEMGVEVEALHHEVGIGQHEIDFKYDEALKTADNAITLKTVLKKIASLFGLYATFMPKPIAGIAGSGMHVHQSFFKNGKNVFFDKDDPYYLSEVAKSFIAGQMAHIRAINALTNPLVNSYKRLVVGYEAPVYVTWAHINRSALIRIPRFTKGRSQAARCEFRCPDSACNPYLAFAVMLAAGLDGIKKKMKPPKPVEENVYQMTHEEMMARGIVTVAPDLKAALTALRDDSVIRGVLGEATFEKYYRAKKTEWDEYKVTVSEWEVQKYLGIY